MPIRYTMKEPMKRIITTLQEIYYDKCDVCGKEIAGKGVAGFRSNMSRHMREIHGVEKKE